MSAPVFEFHQGHLPLLVSMPHVGTHIPDHIASNMTDVASLRADTDWHLPLLYNMLKEIGASFIVANYSRYVIDLNRARDNANLYPGQDTTGLCPVDTFAKQALYKENCLPTEVEIQARIQDYWMPYHSQLQAELLRLRDQFGCAVLWDAHSIASVVPRFFDGKLPDLNFGTADAKSCSNELVTRIEQGLARHAAAGYSHVFNGRFKGGYITRHYGQPEHSIHAIQLEMSQCVYMNEAPPFEYLPAQVGPVQALLSDLLQSCAKWAAAQSKQ